MATYRTIDAVKKAGEILDFIADQRVPVGGKEVSDGIGMAFGTVMSHLATLEEMGWLTRIGERYEMGMKVALFWSRKKSQLEGKRENINKEINALEV
jgi:DNA-binding IclR family transcriptional regulator